MIKVFCCCWLSPKVFNQKSRPTWNSMASKAASLRLLEAFSWNAVWSSSKYLLFFSKSYTAQQGSLLSVKGNEMITKYRQVWLNLFSKANTYKNLFMLYDLIYFLAVYNVSRSFWWYQFSLMPLNDLSFQTGCSKKVSILKHQKKFLTKISKTSIHNTRQARNCYLY